MQSLTIISILKLTLSYNNGKGLIKMYQERIQKLQQQMQQDNIANQLISSPTSIRYFTSYDSQPGERFYLLNIPVMGQPILYLNPVVLH